MVVQPYLPKSINYDTFRETDEEYQRYVIRILSVQAYAEKLGADEMGAQLHLAPDYRSRKSLARIVADEAEHAFLLYTILEKIGVSEFEAIAIAEGKTTGGVATQSLVGAKAVGDENNEWLDLVLNNLFMDRAGSFMVENFAQSSFEPWALACEQIYRDEQWHKAFGLRAFENFLETSKDSSISEKVTLWFVHALNFFGPPSIHTQNKLKAYGIKPKSNDALREAFVAEVKQLLQKKNFNHWLRFDSITKQYPFQFENGVNL